jgi:L-rhamnose mutarotase
MRVALHTRVRADRIGEYERAHDAVPAGLTAAIRAADLFHVIDCADYAAMLAALNADPVNVEWQARMAELLDTPHDYSAAGGEAALPVAWQL